MQSDLEKSEIWKSNGENSYAFAARPKSVEHFALQRTGLHPHPREPNPEFVASFASRSQNSCNFIRLVFSRLHPASPRIAHTSMLLLSWVRELRSSQSFEPTSPAGKRCFLGGTETSGGLTALRNPPGVFPMGPSTEETWNRFRNPETWLMLRRK